MCCYERESGVDIKIGHWWSSFHVTPRQVRFYWLWVERDMPKTASSLEKKIVQGDKIVGESLVNRLNRSKSQKKKPNSNDDNDLDDESDSAYKYNSK